MIGKPEIDNPLAPRQRMPAVGPHKRQEMLDRVDLPHEIVTRNEPPQETIQAR